VNAVGSVNSPGAVIDSSDHRSIRLFSSGVPVSAILTRARRVRTALYAFDARFFTNCASSSSTAAQGSAR